MSASNCCGTERIFCFTSPIQESSTRRQPCGTSTAPTLFFRHPRFCKCVHVGVKQVARRGRPSVRPHNTEEPPTVVQMKPKAPSACQSATHQGPQCRFQENIVVWPLRKKQGPMQVIHGAYVLPGFLANAFHYGTKLLGVCRPFCRQEGTTGIKTVHVVHVVHEVGKK